MPFTKIYSFFTEDKLEEYKDLSKLLKDNYSEIVKLTKFKNKNADNQYCVSIILNKDIDKEQFSNIIEDTSTLLGIPSSYQYYYYKNGKEAKNVKYTFTNKPDKPDKPENVKLGFVEDEEC